MADKGKVNYDTFVMRHGLFRNLPKGKLGEPLYCTDTHELYIGQGEDKAPIPVVAQGGSGTDVNGMFFSVDTIAERDALKYTYNIQNGAMCYVAQEDMYYKYSNGEWGEANFGTGGGGTTGSLTSEMDEDLTLSVNNDLRMSYFFSSPNAGKGNLKVFINGVEVVSNSISQGAGVVTVPESAFTKGATHTLVMYVIDRAEIFTNSLTFYVTYGGLEISTTFDSASSYDVGSTIRCYYTPTSVKTLPIKLYVKIDGELQEPLSCTANTRNTYTFPRTLDAGSHNIQMWVADADGQSNVLMFPLVLLSSDSLVITSTVQEVEAEEGDQVSLDYKVSMKNQTAFNTKYYIDEVLAQTGTCGVVKTAWNTSTLTKGSHKLRLYVETQAKGDDGTTPLATASYTWDVVIVESSYQIVRPVTAGCIGMFTAQDRTNTASDKEIWVGVDEDSREVVADLYNYGYTNSNGWVDNSLISNGSSYVKIPIKPLANDGGKQGVTIDIEFSTRDIGVEDATILDCYNDDMDCGIRITKDKAIMKSLSGNSINLDYSQEENTHITLVLNRLDRMAMGYINGVLCEAFYLSDTGEGDATQQESFLVDDYIYLNCRHIPPSQDVEEVFDRIGWSKIKNVRIYNIALTNEEVLQNFVANITDKDTQRAKMQFQKGATLPTMTFTGSTKGMGKGKPKTMKITYNSTDELKYGKSFELKNCSVEWQGTSSLQYVVKNYKIKLKDDSGNKYKYNPYGETEALPESTFCLKADYMESSHANNTGLAKFITKYLYQGDTIELSPPRQVYAGVRDTITGFPIRLVINDVQDNGEIITKDMGIFNFNLDKGCTDSFGLDTEKYPNCMSYEVTANSDTSAGAFFSYGYQIDENTVAGSEFDTELEYLQNSFELRYPDDKVVGSDYGYISNLKRVIDWVSSTPVGTEDEKKAFRDQFPNYFDKGYTLRYLLCVLVFGMVDNLGKNMMLDTWDGQIWYPRFYDLDTSFGLDNSGVLKFSSDIEIVAGTFNTSKSQLWSKVMIAFENELKTEYQYMRTGKFNEANIMEFMYGEQISKIPESYYNSDAQTKYLDFGALYLGKLHGNRYQHMKKWIKNRLLYVDTLLDYTSSTDDSITVRAGTLEEIQLHITTFVPMYVRIKWKNGYTAKYRSDGKTPFIATYRLDTETDQEVLIYGGSQLKKIDGLSSAVPESMDIANASRLTELVVHSSKLKNINGTTSGGVNVSGLSNITKLDVSNCSALTGALNVNGCNLLTHIYTQGTQVSDIQLPSNGANLREVWYSTSVQTININNMDALKIVGLQSGHSCKVLSLVNCPNVVAFGDRQYDPASQTYKYKNSKWLSGLQNVTLDNSCLGFQSWEMLECVGIKSITLKNMPNLRKLHMGINTKINPGDYGATKGQWKFTEFITPEYMEGLTDVIISSQNCPNLKSFVITYEDRKSYVEASGLPNYSYGTGNDGNADSLNRCKHMWGFMAKCLDISNTSFEDVRLLCQCDIYELKLPSTVNTFIADSYFDYSNDGLNYDITHSKARLDDSNASLTGLHYGILVNHGIVLPPANCGSTIWRMWCPDKCAEPEIMYDEGQTQILAYPWDLTGLEFKDFYAWDLNKRILSSYYNNKNFTVNNLGIWAMPTDNTCWIKSKSDLYRVQIRNLNVKCTTLDCPLNPYIVPSAESGVEHYVNCNIDYSSLPSDYKYWVWGLAGKSTDNVTLKLPSTINGEGYYGGCLYYYKNLSATQDNNVFVRQFMNQQNYDTYDTRGVQIGHTSLDYAYIHDSNAFIDSSINYIKELHAENISLANTGINLVDLYVNEALAKGYDNMFGLSTDHFAKHIYLSKGSDHGSDKFSNLNLSGLDFKVSGYADLGVNYFRESIFGSLDLSELELSSTRGTNYAFYGTTIENGDLVIKGNNLTQCKGGVTVRNGNVDFRGCPNLTVLDISGGNISGTLDLSNCSQLTYYNLGNTKFNDIIFPFNQYVPDIVTEFNVSGTTLPFVPLFKETSRCAKIGYSSMKVAKANRIHELLIPATCTSFSIRMSKIMAEDSFTLDMSRVDGGDLTGLFSNTLLSRNFKVIMPIHAKVGTAPNNETGAVAGDMFAYNWSYAWDTKLGGAVKSFDIDWTYNQDEYVIFFANSFMSFFGHGTEGTVMKNLNFDKFYTGGQQYGASIRVKDITVQAKASKQNIYISNWHMNQDIMLKLVTDALDTTTSGCSISLSSKTFANQDRTEEEKSEIEAICNAKGWTVGWNTSWDSYTEDMVGGAWDNEQ